MTNMYSLNSLANSYTGYFYFFSTASYSIDRVKIVFRRYRQKFLLGMLMHHFRLISHHKASIDGKIIDHTFIDTFINHHGKKFRYIYSFANFTWWNSIHFHQPNFQIQLEVEKTLNSVGVNPIHSQIELAVDVEIDDLIGFKDWIEATLFQKYQKAPSFFNVDTFYTTDIRTKSRGIRVYKKQVDRKKVVRVELQLNRASIRSAELFFPVKELTVDLSRYYDFRIVEWEKLKRYLIKKAEPDISEMNQQMPGSGDLLVRTIESYLFSRQDESLMSQVELLKSKKHGVENYSRFFRKIEPDGQPVLGVRTFSC